MKKNDYVKTLNNKLKISAKHKKRFCNDIESDINCMLDDGMSYDEIVKVKGSPEILANTINEEYKGTDIETHYKIQKSMLYTLLFLICAFSVLLISVLIVSLLSNLLVIDSAVGAGDIFISDLRGYIDLTRTVSILLTIMTITLIAILILLVLYKRDCKKY